MEPVAAQPRPFGGARFHGQVFKIMSVEHKKFFNIAAVGRSNVNCMVRAIGSLTVDQPPQLQVIACPAKPLPDRDGVAAALHGIGGIAGAMQSALITDASEEVRSAQIFRPNAVKVFGITLEQLSVLPIDEPTMRDGTATGSVRAIRDVPGVNSTFLWHVGQQYDRNGNLDYEDPIVGNPTAIVYLILPVDPAMVPDHPLSMCARAVEMAEVVSTSEDIHALLAPAPRSSVRHEAPCGSGPHAPTQASWEVVTRAPRARATPIVPRQAAAPSSALPTRASAARAPSPSAAAPRAPSMSGAASSSASPSAGRWTCVPAAAPRPGLFGGAAPYAARAQTCGG